MTAGARQRRHRLAAASVASSAAALVLIALSVATGAPAFTSLAVLAMVVGVFALALCMAAEPSHPRSTFPAPTDRSEK